MIYIGTPHTKGAGYFVNNKDDRRTKQEADIQTCAHCQKILKMREWREQGAWCAREQKPICYECGGLAEIHGCIPFMKRIEREFENTMRYQQLSKLVGLDKPAVPQSLYTGG